MFKSIEVEITETNVSFKESIKEYINKEALVISKTPSKDKHIFETLRAEGQRKKVILVNEMYNPLQMSGVQRNK